MQPSHFCWPHLPLDFHFSCPRARAICFDCGLQNSTDKTNLPQSIRSLEINQTFYVLTFQETFSSDAIFRRGRKVREEAKRGRKGTIQEASKTFVRWLEFLKIVNLEYFFDEISLQMSSLVPNGDK